MKKIIASVLLLSSFATFGQDCLEATSTYETKECLSKQLDSADADLNAQYKACMEKQDEVGKNKLRTAQRAWISFRDAECEYQADEMRDGSYESVLYMACTLEKTKERASTFKDCVEFR